MTANNYQYQPPDWFKYFLIALAVLWLGFLLTGCTTARKATRYFDRHGFEAAKYCAMNFPVRDSVGMPDTTYRQARNTDYTRQIDSLKKGFDSQLQAFKDAQKKQANDTSCLRTIRELQDRYERLLYSFDSLHAKYKPCNPDTAYIKVPHYVENTAKTASLQRRLTLTTDRAERAENGRGKWRGRAIWTWVVIVVLGGGYLFIKNKISFLTGIIKKITNGKG